MAEYATKGTAGTALGLAIGGLGTQLLSGGLNGILGGCANNCSENMPVNRYELNQEKTIAEKNAEIAYLKGQNETNEKITAAYANLEAQIRAVSDKMQMNKDEQYAINLQQAVYNGTNTATLNCIQAQVNQLLGITKLVIPNASVCPGWDTTSTT